MNVRPKSVFKHGKVIFDPAKVYAVSMELGFYFIAHGWASATDDPADETPSAADLGPEPIPAKGEAGSSGVTLQPQDATSQPKSR